MAVAAIIKSMSSILFPNRYRKASIPRHLPKSSGSAKLWRFDKIVDDASIGQGVGGQHLDITFNEMPIQSIYFNAIILQSNCNIAKQLQFNNDPTYTTRRIVSTTLVQKPGEGSLVSFWNSRGV